MLQKNLTFSILRKKSKIYLTRIADSDNLMNVDISTR